MYVEERRYIWHEPVGNMLLELIVENYAVVEQARMRFHEGLNILTGETGSGKSIVVDSLSLLLGARASAEMVRSWQPSARSCVGNLFGERSGGRSRRFEGVRH